MGARERTIEVSGVEVTTTEKLNKPLLVLTRMADRKIGLWDGIWDRLAERFALAAIQPRMPPASAFDDPVKVFRNLAAQCAACARDLGHERFHVLGWNGGSHIALRCAVDHSDRIASCVLVGAFHQLKDGRRTAAGIAFMKAMLCAGDPLLYSRYWVMSGLSPAFVEANFDRVEAWAVARASGDRFVSSDRDAAFRWVEALRQHWLTPEEGRALKTPTLIIAPELDLWHAGPNVAMARSVQAGIPHAVLETVPDRGSLYPLEDPDGFIQKLLRFHDTMKA